LGRDDWFRLTTWTDDDQAAFWARWKRSRTPFHKAQYLRVQAWTLIGQADPALIRCGIELGRRMLNEFPDQRTETATVQHAIGHGLVKLGSLEAALEAFRSAAKTERTYPNVQVGAELSFAMLVAANDMTSFDVEAGELLDEWRAKVKGGSLPYPIFIDAGARAVFAAHRGETADAARWARAALEQADRTTSGLQYHADFGLVPKHDPMVQSLLARCRHIASE
jgi:hypothetical protein